MADVLQLKDGTVHILFEPKHFAELVDQYMGWDAEKYFTGLVDRLIEAADKTAVDTDLIFYESSLDSNRDAFQEILEGLEKLETMLDGRTNKAKALGLVNRLQKIINNQI